MVPQKDFVYEVSMAALKRLDQLTDVIGAASRCVDGCKLRTS